MEQEWISMNEFMRRNHMGYDTAVKLINSGKIEYQKVEKQYKIKVSKDENINESMDHHIRENEELKSYIKTIQNISNQVKI